MTCSSKEQAVRSACGRLSVRNYKYYLSKLVSTPGHCSQSCEAATAEILTSCSVVSTNVSERINSEQREPVLQQTPIWTLYLQEHRPAVYISELSAQISSYFLFCPFRLFNSPAGSKQMMSSLNCNSALCYRVCSG